MLDRIRVAKVEEKPSKNNTKLYTITGTDGSRQSQFSDKVDLSTIKEGSGYEFTIELDRTKQYRNITAFRELTIQEAAALKDTEMTRSDWDQKDKRKEVMTNGRTAYISIKDMIVAGIWEGDERDKWLAEFEDLTRQLIKEMRDCMSLIPLKNPEIMPKEGQRLLEQGKTICYLLNLDPVADLEVFAATQKSSTKPYPSWSLLNAWVKKLQAASKELECGQTT
jgi:hypothetical protein